MEEKGAGGEGIRMLYNGVDMRLVGSSRISNWSRKEDATVTTRGYDGTSARKPFLVEAEDDKSGAEEV